MTFLEAALQILRREGRPLHYKDLTERAMGKKLLTFVGRTPEVTMQTQLTAAVKKAPGNPFVRVKPGIFGLLRYPEMPPEEAAAEPERDGEPAAVKAGAREDATRRRRRRRGGRGRTREEAAANGVASGANHNGEGEGRGEDNAGAEGAGDGDGDEPVAVGGLSAEARAAALAETGVLEAEDEASADAEDDSPMAERDDDDEEGPEEMSPGSSDDMSDDMSSDASADALDDEGRASPGARGAEAADDGEPDLEEGEEDEEGDKGELSAGEAGAGDAARAGPGDDLVGGRRRRRRRRRRRDGEGFSETGGRLSGSSGELGGATEQGPGSTGGAESTAVGAGAGEPGLGDESRSGAEGGGEAGEGQAPRRILTPVDAALEILRGQAPGRGVHVRQIADAAARRRLIHGEPNEAWRVMRTALAAEPRERMRAGLRPRVRSAGAGLFALARRPPDPELERAEHVFGEARRALRERTIAALERRIAELPDPAFEALARVLLQREGFGPATFVKRVERTIYVEALRGRGTRPSKCLIALRPGTSSSGRRGIGELRAGIRVRNQDEGLLMIAGRLADDAIFEWKQAGAPIEIADGQAMAETCVRHGIGVINTTISVDFVDADFFAELAEG